MNKPLTLYELNTLVRAVIEQTLDDCYWITAELSECRTNRGHCYLEFVQKQECGNAIVAKARGQIWAGRWSLLRPYFERTTGQILSAGMSILAKVEVTFHEAYGYSLNVIDIDPSYTLGDIARRRQEIMRQLRQEGIAEMNKELPLPRLLQRIAIISTETAAGYQDFCRSLVDNAYNLTFHTRLFPAVMQGERVEESIIAALNRIAAEAEEWDAVVIIRGGGATSDLHGFDSLALAENIAQFSLPIITGIGHERDDTVIDLVAHTRVKTPTAAAEFLVQHQKAEYDTLSMLAEALQSLSVNTLKEHQNRLDRIAELLPSHCHLTCQRAENRLERLASGIASTLRLRLQSEAERSRRLTDQLRFALQQTLTHEEQRLTLTEERIKSADPKYLLKLGYSITRLNGKAVTDPRILNPGDVITTTLAHGTITSTIATSQSNE